MELSTVHSLWLAPLCLALGAGLAWWLYRRPGPRDGFTPALAMTLAILRALAIALLAFFLLEPMVRIMVREVRRPVVVIAHDGSGSLLAAGDTTLLRGAFAASLQQLAGDLGVRYDVRTLSYGERVRDGLLFDQSDAHTDMGEVLLAVYDRYGGSDLGAVILTGDGIYNRGRDPRLVAQRLGVPVHTIALGDTTVRPDLVLQALEHNKINFLGNEFPVLVRVEAHHLKGIRSRITITQGDRELAGRELVVGSDPFLQEFTFSLRAEKAGLQRYTVTIEPVEEEYTALNNAQDLHIDVLDDRQKILLLGAAPHPDLGALRLALEAMEGYSTELAYASDFNGDVGEHDLVVLHQLPSSRYGLQDLLQRAAEREVPLWFILGQGTDLNAFNAQTAGMRLVGRGNATSDVQPVVDKAFTAFTLEPAQVRALERFPPVQVPFGQYELGRSATAVLLQRIGAVRTTQPLVALVQQGERRMATVAGEGLWRWRLADMQQNGSHGHFDRFVHKLVQFLAIKADKRRFRVDHAPEFPESSGVMMTAELYNPSLERVNGPEVDIVLRDEQGREYPFSFGRTSDAYRLQTGRLPAGPYTWRARTELDGEQFNASGQLLVRGSVLERIRTVADHGLMADIAASTGGGMVTPERLDELAGIMNERGDLAARSYVHASFSDLIGLRWIFFVLLALLTAEWSLRRWNGSY